MASIDRIADIVSRLADQPGARILVGTSTAEPGVVQVGGSRIEVATWINRPLSEGRDVVLVMQGGTAVGLGTGGRTSTGVWRYGPETDMTVDPGSGYLRTSGVGTGLTLSTTTNAGTDAVAVLQAMGIGDQIYVQEQSDASLWARYEVGGEPVDHGSWFSFPVTLLESGTAEPNRNANLTVVLEYGSGGSGGLGDGSSLYVLKTGDTMAGDLALLGTYGTAGEGQRAITFTTTDYPEQDVRIQGEVGDANLTSAGTGLVITAPNSLQNVQVELQGGSGSGLWVNGDRAQTGDTGWIALSSVGYNSPWRDHPGGVWTPYYRKKGGVVYFRGLVNPSATVGSGSIICTMPAGFRPNTPTDRGHHFSVSCGDYATQYIRMYGSGRMDCGRGEQANIWVSLDNVSYVADNP
jgi:hypothetical protein